VSAKQAIDDKLQGSVATHLRCGGVGNNRIKKGLLLSLWVNFLIGEYMAKLQTRACTLHAWPGHCWRAWLSHAPEKPTAKWGRKCTRQSLCPCYFTHALTRAEFMRNSCVSDVITGLYSLKSWWHGTVVERRSLTGELSLSCARPAADGWPLKWVCRPLQVSQLGQLSLSSFLGR